MAYRYTAVYLYWVIQTRSCLLTCGNVEKESSHIKNTDSFLVILLLFFRKKWNWSPRFQDYERYVHLTDITRHRVIDKWTYGNKFDTLNTLYLSEDGKHVKNKWHELCF